MSSRKAAHAASHRTSSTRSRRCMTLSRTLMRLPRIPLLKKSPRHFGAPRIRKLFATSGHCLSIATVDLLVGPVFSCEIENRTSIYICQVVLQVENDAEFRVSSE